MREFTLFLVLMGCLVGSFVIAMSRHKSRSDTRRRRLELLSEALRDPSLDPATRADLLRTLARENDRPLATWLIDRLQRRELWRGLWFGAGWLMFVVGGLLFTGSSFDLVYGMNRMPVALAAALGFAMVTLPLGWRELSRRDAAAPSR